MISGPLPLLIDGDFGENVKSLNDLIQRRGKEKYVCLACMFEAKRKDGIKRHLKMVHFAGERVTCPGCGSTYKNKYVLQTHLNRKQCLKPPVDPISIIEPTISLDLDLSLDQQSFDDQKLLAADDDDDNDTNLVPKTE